MDSYIHDQKVRYFGRALPPKCELRGCYHSDDGCHFYCTNMGCDKHKSRRTKHTRYSRFDHLKGSAPAAAPPVGAPDAATEPARAAAPNVHFGPPASMGFWPIVHFACPACGSARVEMRIFKNVYECNDCQHAWK